MAQTTPPDITTVNRQPIIDYVTKDYEGFRQAMLNEIPQLLPNWTDRSESDFGVVLIELFAYVSDILSYYQDRIANEAYLDTATQRRSVVELLRLLNYQIDPGLAAASMIHFDVSADAAVLEADLPYQLKTEGVPGETDKHFEIVQSFKLRLLNNAIDLTALAELPTGLTSVELDNTAHGLVEGDTVYLEQVTTEPDGSKKTRRSPILRVTNVVSIAADKDAISWLPALPEPLDPQITTLNGNNISASHGETISDEPVYVGNGTPGQSLTLSRKPVTHLLKSGTYKRRRSSPEMQVLVDGTPWEEVENLFNSRPSDTHYFTTINEEDYLTIYFGTGNRGSVVPTGARVEVTYRIGIGSQGNVGADTLTVFLSSIPAVTAITNPLNAVGGAERESTAEAKISGPGSVIAQERAVTLQDHELLSEAFPGVGKAKARVGLRGGFKVVQVYIAPENPGVIPLPLPSGELKDALKQHLEARQPVNRMAGVDVLDPIYVPIDISIDVHLLAEANQTDVSENVLAELREMLSFANQDFGQSVRLGEVYAVLHSINGVAHIVLKRLARSDAPHITTSDACDFADIPIAENELPYEGDLVLNLFGGGQ
ncbi:MAG: putative baseplate assembly protein [Calditrichaeota bacterium]|nr:putative baseplate assembly protein [Calditrichota bacterium]